jgi:hypothetical protein
MATRNPTEPGESQRFQTTYEEDEQLEGAVLRHVLDLHPEITPSKEELIREMTGGATNASSVDAVERAVRELTANGLFHPAEGRSQFIRPTRAASRFCELQGGV